MKYKGIVFDLDGVICFTDRYHYRAWKQAVASLGVPFDETVNNRLRGVSRMDSLNIILENYTGDLSEEEKLALCEKKNRIYKKLLSGLSSKDVSKDVLDTLFYLKGMGVKIAIGSSNKNTKLILKNLGIIDVFDAIADGNDILKSKPDPEVFLKAAEKLKLKPCECAVVEDAFAGIEAAKRGGFFAIAIGDASKSGLADISITKLSDVLEIP